MYCSGSLPQNDEVWRVREKMFSEMDLDDFKKDTGFTEFFLDFKRYGEDDVMDGLDKFEDFEEYRRDDGQLMWFHNKIWSKVQRIDKNYI